MLHDSTTDEGWLLGQHTRSLRPRSISNPSPVHRKANEDTREMVEYQAAGGTQVSVLPGGLKLVVWKMSELIHGWILQWRKGEGGLVLDVTALHHNIPVTHLPNTCMPPPSSHSHPVNQSTCHWTPTPLISLMRFFTLNTPPARLLLSIATHTTHATPVSTHPHALAPALAAPYPPISSKSLSNQGTLRNDVYWRVSQRKVMDQGAA